MEVTARRRGQTFGYEGLSDVSILNVIHIGVFLLESSSPKGPQNHCDLDFGWPRVENKWMQFHVYGYGAADKLGIGSLWLWASGLMILSSEHHSGAQTHRECQS